MSRLVTSITPVKGAPGTTITCGVDTAVPSTQTVTLPTPPANARRMTVQNAGPAGTWVRIRQSGGTSGAGRLLPRLGEATYGGLDGAITTLEAEDVSTAVGGAPISTVISITFEV
jgi:hypothetical protein